MKRIKTLLLAFFAFAPGVSFGQKDGALNYEAPEENNDIYVLPGETVQLSIAGTHLEIRHSTLMEKYGFRTSKNYSNAIGVKIHEETLTMDFTNFDGITVRLPIHDIEAAPPNFVAGAKAQIRKSDNKNEIYRNR